MSPTPIHPTGFPHRVSVIVDQVQALEDQARRAGLRAIAARLRRARQHLVEAAYALLWREGASDEGRDHLADIEEAARFLEWGVDTVLLMVPGEVARLTRDDLPAIRRFLADADATRALPGSLLRPERRRHDERGARLHRRTTGKRASRGIKYRMPMRGSESEGPMGAIHSARTDDTPEDPLHVGEPDACARDWRDTALGSPPAETVHGKESSGWALDFLRASGAAAHVRKGIWSLCSVRADGWALTTNDGMTIIISGGVEQDGRRWLHCSVSRPDRMPTYDDLAGVKRIVFGPDREAYQKFARRREHVNIHEHCLHLWHCLDGDRLPDFTRGGRSL